MIDDRGIGFALGASEYLVKPVHREELLEALGRCVAPLRERPYGSRDRRRARSISNSSRPCWRPRVVGPMCIRRRGGGASSCGASAPQSCLLDLLMPDVDGFEVVERLHADPLVVDVPIVVLTSKEITPADHERLTGRISYLAQKGTLRPCRAHRPRWSLSDAPTVAQGSAVTGKHYPHRRGQRRNRKLTRDMLEPCGLPHSRGDNAEDGLRWPAPNARLVLMDVQLPGMDGVEALGRLSADPATAASPSSRSPRSR